MRYSVYVFLDQLNRPYYVGKTNNMKRRRKEHLDEAAKGNPLPKYNKIRDLQKKGHPLKMRALKVTTDETEAFRLERLYIKKYRKAGYVLMNCTHGGPDELPLRINKPKKLNTRGIVIPKRKKNKITLKVTSKKRRKVSKIRKRR